MTTLCAEKVYITMETNVTYYSRDANKELLPSYQED